MAAIDTVVFTAPVRNYNGNQLSAGLVGFEFAPPGTDGWAFLRATITNFNPGSSLRVWFEKMIAGVWQYSGGDGSYVAGVPGGIYPADETPAEWTCSFDPRATRFRLNADLIGSCRASLTAGIHSVTP